MKSYFTPALLFILLASSLAAQDYAIKLHQPLTVGQRYEFTVTASESSENSMTSDQRAPKTQKEELSVELESVATVLEVDAKGRPVKESHKIVKLLVGTNKAPALAAGTIVVASRPGRKMVFDIAGKTPPSTVTKALEAAIDITSGGPTDDEIFGAKERKKVGDTWPINEALASKDVNAKLGGLGMNIESVKGATTLQSVSHEGGVDVINLVADLSATMAPSGKGPFTSVKGTMKAKFGGAFPEDIAKSLRKEELTMTVAFDLSGKPNPEGPVVQISGKAIRSATRQYKLLK